MTGKADDDILDEMCGIKPRPPAEAVAGNRLARIDPKKYLAPEKLTKLAPEHRLMIGYMVHGVSSPVRARQLRCGVDIPLTFLEAADAARVRRRAARRLINDPLFRAELAKEIRGYRESLAPEAVRTIAAIVADPGENTAADRTVRIKAATLLLGENASGGGSTNVQVNLHGGDGQRLTAGVVVRLPSTTRQTPGEAALIELQAEATPANEFHLGDDGQLRIRQK
jgi:hypothetical protein